VVRLDEKIGAHLIKAEGSNYQGVTLQTVSRAASAIELYRFPKG
jgi:hypothetical protein